MAARFDTVIALRLPGDVVNKLKARAREDDRSLSAYTRRLIIQAVQG